MKFKVGFNLIVVDKFSKIVPKNLVLNGNHTSLDLTKYGKIMFASSMVYQNLIKNF